MNRPDEIAALVARELGEPPADVALIPTLEHNEVWRFRLGDRPLILKTLDPHRTAAEVAAMRAAKASGVPVVDVVAADEWGDRWDHPFFVMEEARGELLSDVAERGVDVEAPVRALGAALRVLHSIPVDGAGRFDHAALRSGTFRGVHRSDASMVAETSYAQPYILKHELLRAEEVATATAILARESLAFEDSRSVLLHADVGTDHVFVDPGTLELTAIIDFGDARIGDPAWEFANMALHEQDLLPVAIDAYTRDPDELAHLRARLVACRLARLLGEIRWCHERAIPIEEDVAKLRATIAAL